jgi:glycosyltransferase involved in cell wall biosynthesis
VPHSPRDLNVCFLADGIGPSSIGGVSRFAAALAAGLPHRSFAMAGSDGELPPARLYHALTPAAAARAGEQVHAIGRPLLLTCHAMSDAWRPAGAPVIGPDSSYGGGGWSDDDRHHDSGGTSDDSSEHEDDGTDDGYEGPDDHVRLERHGYAAADLIAAVADAVAASHAAAGAPADRMLVIRNGVDPAEAERQVRDPLVGFVGRLAPVKGLERLLGAMRAVRSERPDARLVLVGPVEGRPGYGRHLRRLANRSGLRGAVTFTGADQPSRWYPPLACMALASETEGMPLALLEAMSHGVPCVAPDVGGIREALGSAGLLVPARDTDALAEAILRILGDSAEAARLGSAARERADRWTAADAAAAYDLLYAELGCPTSCC